MQQYCRRTAAAVALTLVLCLAGVSGALALEAERGTVLAYLIELYRKQNKPCGDRSMPQPPPLLYSEPLRDAARELAEGGNRDLQTILAAQKLHAARFHMFSASEAKAEDAMARLKADHCVELLENYTHIGATRTNERWLVIMATLEPLRVPENATPGGAASGGSPDVSTPGETAPVVGMLAAPTQTAPAAPAQTPPAQSAKPRAAAQSTAVSPEAKAIAARINAIRANGVSCGGKHKAAVSPLASNPALTKAAQKHAQDMADQGYFSTTSPSGITLENRVGTEGYAWGLITELISKGPPPASAVVDLWLSSPSQCEQIMNPAFVDMGVGVIGEYWAVIFARAAVGVPGPERSGARE